MKQHRTNITIFDPWANPEEVQNEYGLKCHTELIEESQYDAIVLAVAYKEFLSLDLNSFLNDEGIVYDFKGVFDFTI